VKHSVDLIEDKVKDSSPFVNFGHIQFGKINLDVHKNFKKLTKKIEETEMTKIIGFAIWPVNNKFDVISIEDADDPLSAYTSFI